MLERLHHHWPMIVAVATVSGFLLVLAAVWRNQHKITDLNQEVVRITEVVEGTPGPAGEPGLIGKVGKPGPQGPQGSTGRQGPQGKRGPEGPQGESGPAGDRGRRGRPGTTLTPGQLERMLNSALASHTLVCTVQGSLSKEKVTLKCHLS